MRGQLESCSPGATDRDPHAMKALSRILVVVVLALVAAEVVIRVRAHAKYGRFLDVYDLYTRHEVEHAGRSASVLSLRPGLAVEFAGRSRIETDSRGFRSPEVAVPKPAGTVRLAFVGGSTTFCGQASSNERTWPHLVCEGLRDAFPGVRFDYVNAGVTGNRVEDSLLALEHRIRAVEPDVIVLYHAANDLATDTAELARAAGIAVPEEGRRDTLLERVSLLWKLVGKNRRFQAAQEQGRSPNAKLALDEAARERLAGAFGERLDRLVRRAGELAPLVVLPTFLTKFRAEQAPGERLANLVQSFTFMPYLTPEATLAAYAAYNTAIVRVAGAEGALLVAGGVPPGDDAHFADSVHFTEVGCAAMARRVLEALRGDPRLPALVAAARGSEVPAGTAGVGASAPEAGR